MAIDLKRLAQEAQTLHHQRAQRPPSGTYTAIRLALPGILALRAEGVRWADIAAALAAQGITQGAGDDVRPISTSRLTALVSDIQKRELEKRDRAVRRAERPDLSRPEPEKRDRTVDRKLRLAPELGIKPDDVSPASQHRSEEAIRRSQLEGIQHLLKKGD